jgi:hypothetical protein
MARRSDSYQENNSSLYRGGATRSSRSSRSSYANSTGSVESERVSAPQRRRALTPREKYEAASRQKGTDSGQNQRLGETQPRYSRAEAVRSQQNEGVQSRPQSRPQTRSQSRPQSRSQRPAPSTRETQQRVARTSHSGRVLGEDRRSMTERPRHLGVTERSRRTEPHHHGVTERPRHYGVTERPRHTEPHHAEEGEILVDREALVSNAKEKLSGLVSKAQTIAAEAKNSDMPEKGSTLAEERSPHILPAFFLGLITALLVLGIVLPDSDFSQTENRQLQVAPEVSIDNFLNGTFQSEFQTYVEDQFPFRDTWVTLKSVASTISGRVENNGVYRCGDGTLILEFVEPEKDTAAEAVVKFTEAHKDDMNIYTLVSPTAAGIWSDKLPSQVVMDDQKAYLEGINSQFAEAGAKVVDVWKAFEAKKDFDLFYRTDHHWTTYGAQLAYMNLANEMDMNVSYKTYNDLVVKSDFAGSLTAQGGYFLSGTEDLHVYLRSDQDVPCVVTYTSEKEKTSSPYVSSALDKRDAYEVFFGGNHSLIEIDCYAENSRGTLLVIKDSYANSLIPFLIGDYERIIVVDPRYYTEDLETLVESNDINDVLFLYNATTFAQDTSLSRLVESGLASLSQSGGGEE